MVNPTSPDEATTRNVLFTINEVYVQPEGIGEHMEAGQQWPHFQSFIGVLTTHGDILVLNGEVIETL